LLCGGNLVAKYKQCGEVKEVRGGAARKNGSLKKQPLKQREQADEVKQ
jgi:hypothetical protein